MLGHTFLPLDVKVRHLLEASWCFQSLEEIHWQCYEQANNVLRRKNQWPQKPIMTHTWHTWLKYHTEIMHFMKDMTSVFYRQSRMAYCTYSQISSMSLHIFQMYLHFQLPNINKTYIIISKIISGKTITTFNVLCSNVKKNIYILTVPANDEKKMFFFHCKKYIFQNIYCFILQ